MVGAVQVPDEVVDGTRRKGEEVGSSWGSEWNRFLFSVG